jgi:hypothetical protein
MLGASSTENAMTILNWILLVLGAACGCYASFVAGQVVLWLQLKHDVFSRIELLSAIINGESIEFKPGEHRLDRILEAKAIEFYFHGHGKAYEECHKIANEIQNTLHRVGAIRGKDYYEISRQKTDWMGRVAALKSTPFAFFGWKRGTSSVLNFYRSKEEEYLRQAKSDISQNGGSVKDLP